MILVLWGSISWKWREQSPRGSSGALGIGQQVGLCGRPPLLGSKGKRFVLLFASPKCASPHWEKQYRARTSSLAEIRAEPGGREWACSHRRQSRVSSPPLRTAAGSNRRGMVRGCHHMDEGEEQAEEKGEDSDGVHTTLI